MKVQKRTSVGGEYAKLEKDFGEEDILEILDAGNIVTGDYGDRHVFKMKTRGGEKNMSFNQTTMNYMIDAYGDDTSTWVGKSAKVWLVDMNVSGKMRAVVFLTDPTWKKVRVNGELKFMPEKAVAEVEKEINVDEIPF